MKKFNRNGKFGRRNSGSFDDGDSKSFSRGRFNRPERRDSRRSSFEKKMYKVTCDKCGESCEVPFKPSGDKPVYCSNCFRKNEHSESKRPDQFTNEFDQINEKLNKIMKALKIDI